MAEPQQFTEPSGSPTWWGAFDDGTVWPVVVLDINIFGTLVRSTHKSGPAGEIWLHQSRVYDNKFKHPQKVRRTS